MAEDASAASRFWVGGTGTWDASTTTHWSATTGGGGGASVPGASDSATIDSSSGSPVITVNTTVSIQSLTVNGTSTLDFSVNNNNVTLTTTTAQTGFTIGSTGTKTVNLGNGTWTMVSSSGSASPWTVSNSGLTFNANNSTLIFNSTVDISMDFGGSLTYHTVTINGGGLVTTIQPNNYTIGTLNLSGTNYIRWNSGNTATINAFNTTSTSTHPLYFSTGQNGGGSTQATISTPNALVVSWINFRDMTKAGAGTLTANNSFDAGGNTNITITPPSPNNTGCLLGG